MSGSNQVTASKPFVFGQLWLHWLTSEEVQNLKLRALKVWLLLLAHAAGQNSTDTFKQTLAEESGIPAKHLQELFRELEAAGLLSREVGKGYGKVAGRKSTKYHMLSPPSIREKEAQAQAALERESTPKRGPSSESTPKRGPSSESTPKRGPSSESTRDLDHREYPKTEITVSTRDLDHREYPRSGSPLRSETQTETQNTHTEQSPEPVCTGRFHPFLRDALEPALRSMPVPLPVEDTEEVEVAGNPAAPGPQFPGPRVPEHQAIPVVLFETFIDNVEKELGPQLWHIWINGHLSAREITAGSAVYLEAESEYYRDFIVDNYMPSLEAAWTKAIGRKMAMVIGPLTDQAPVPIPEPAALMLPEEALRSMAVSLVRAWVEKYKRIDRDPMPAELKLAREWIVKLGLQGSYDLVERASKKLGNRIEDTFSFSGLKMVVGRVAA
ncbi:MAG: hypothetical protein EPO08_20625 [Rhodospirillaceae bacterium]|nr:MAG: hypothetical protein EPO08_20625 [Rhodospirillaceae bacterium]